MSLNRRNPRRDKNEATIVQALEARGFHVDRINGAGIPDLLVSKHGSVWLIEIKTAKGRYTAKQVEWRARFKGPQPWTLRTVDDAMAFPNQRVEDL
jgi:Holliday junction resolvase